MINKVTLIGNVGHTPKITNTDKTKIAAFSIATSERWTSADGEKKEATEWHNIVAFGKTAEIVEKYVEGGAQLYIEGKLKTRSYENKDGVKMYRTEVYVETFKILGRKAQTGAADQQADIAADMQQQGDGTGDLPF